MLDGTGLEAGVLNAGYDSVTVTNGHVHEFDYGIQLNPGSGGNVVSALRVELNQEAGIALSDADQNGIGNTVRHNEIRSNGYGVALFSGTRNAAVRDNALVANQADGVYLEHSRGNLVTANEIDASAGAGVAMIGGGEHTVTANVLTLNGEGVAVGEELLPSDDNRIERNTIEASGGAGLSVNDSSGTLITFNDVTESNGPGAALDLARDSVVRGNDLRGNAGGIELSESSDNLVEFNDAGGALGSGISLEGGSDDNVIVYNTANGNNGEGIEIEDSAIGEDGNLLANNTADSNGGDGIIVTGVGHTLTANRAQLNGGWGIYAPVGAIDGGGNFAAGNVEPGQCVGVVCTLGTVPGTPETHIVDAPPAISNSRNASFTYFGSDDVTPLVDLVFECRLDTTNDLAWEDCDYPHEALNLSPGEHVMEIRAVDLNRAGRPDAGPPRVDLRAAAGGRSAGELRRPRPGGRDVGAGRAVHVPFQRARRHLRVPRRHAPVRALRLRGRGVHAARRLRVGPGGDRGRPPHVPRARDGLRGQRRPAGDLSVEPARRRDAVPLRPGLHARNGGRAGHGRREHERGRDDRLHRQRRRRDL